MKKILSLILVIALCSSVFAVDINPPNEQVVNEGLQEFVTGLAETVPAASTMSNVWSDAYAGQIIGIPPHFGVGASAGAAKMDITGIKKAANERPKTSSLLFATCPSFLVSSFFFAVASSVFSPPGPSLAKNWRLYSKITSSPPQKTQSSFSFHQR